MTNNAPTLGLRNSPHTTFAFSLSNSCGMTCSGVLLFLPLLLPTEDEGLLTGQRHGGEQLRHSQRARWVTYFTERVAVR